jgi:hypothetical protein
MCERPRTHNLLAEEEINREKRREAFTSLYPWMERIGTGNISQSILGLL